MDDIYPFHIAAPPAEGGVQGVQGLTGRVNGNLFLHVLTGGPVYVFRGRRTAKDVQAMLADATGSVDFDLAATVQSGGTSIEIAASGLEYLTVYAPVDSIGFLKVVQDEKTAFKELTEALNELQRCGIRIEHETHASRIPVDTGAPQLRPTRGEDAG
jgi:hypothetical protein